MKALTIARRELTSFFVSPLAYAVLTGFIFLSGFFFFNYLGNFNKTLNQQLAMPLGDPRTMNLNQWVVELYFHTLIVMLIFFIPLLTMRLFAEDKRAGMFELVLTTPVSITDLVVGKALGLFAVVSLLILVTLSFPTLLYALGDPKPEFAPILSGLLGFSLCAVAFSAVGMAIAAAASSQVVAGLSTMVVLLFSYVLLSPAESVGGLGELVLLYLSPAWQVKSLISGVVSLQVLVYFASLIFAGGFFSVLALSRFRWR